jgi:hypothetical protein
VLAREHASGAADAALHLVEDEEDAVLVAELAECAEEAGGRDDVPALPLDWLDEDRGDVARVEPAGPWNAPSKATSAARRVELRASLIAPSTASVPEFVRKTRFLLGPGATRASRSQSAVIDS